MKLTPDFKHKKYYWKYGPKIHSKPLYLANMKLMKLANVLWKMYGIQKVHSEPLSIPGVEIIEF